MVIALGFVAQSISIDWHSKEAVSTCYLSHKARAGAPSIAAEIKAQGFNVSVRTVGRMMRIFGLRARDRVRRHSTNGWLSPVDYETAYYNNIEGTPVHLID